VAEAAVPEEEEVMPTAKNLDAVHRSSDGRLQAHSYEAAVCENCDGFHFDLRDERGNVFATLILPAESLPVLAQAMLEHYNEVSARAIN
jgi:hypothetical protein